MKKDWNIYLQSTEKLHEKYSDAHIIIAGDFNHKMSVLDWIPATNDRATLKHNKPPTKNWINDLVTNSQLVVDIYRSLNLETTKFSHKSYVNDNKFPSESRIDFALVSTSVEAITTKAEIDDEFIDEYMHHKAISITIDLEIFRLDSREEFTDINKISTLNNSDKKLKAFYNAVNNDPEITEISNKLTEATLNDEQDELNQQDGLITYTMC